MKRLINLMLVCMTLVVFASCERVAPNYAGVLIGELWEARKRGF